MTLADTDVLIDYLDRREPAAGILTGYLHRDELQTTVVTCFELLSGARPGPRGERVREFVPDLDIVPLDRVAAEHAALVRHQRERDGLPIGMGDSLIAGIALANGLVLLTRNRKHFERVIGLELPPIG